MRRLSDEDYQRAFRYARSLGADRELALDLVQSAVMKGLAVGSRIDDPLGYLLTSVRNGYISDVRHAQRLRWSRLDEIEGVIATDLQPLEDVVVNRDALEQVWSELGDAEREVLHLWAVEGYTVDEISAQTRTPRGTLLARMHRLRQRLANHPSNDALGASR
ncbi:MAG: RNA polymerase sigma factor [Lysobacteraceae bacterium]